MDIKKAIGLIKIMPEVNIKALEKAFNGDLDLVLFYVSWIKCGMNASKAYKELHPDVDVSSSYVLGSRMLKKVNRELIMEAYGLNQEMYFNQLKDGNGATKWNDFTGEREADHRVRKDYHDKLGKLLGIETDKPLVQINDMKLEIIQDASQIK